MFIPWLLEILVQRCAFKADKHQALLKCTSLLGASEITPEEEQFIHRIILKFVFILFFANFQCVFSNSEKCTGFHVEDVRNGILSKFYLAFGQIMEIDSDLSVNKSCLSKTKYMPFPLHSFY